MVAAAPAGWNGTLMRRTLPVAVVLLAALAGGAGGFAVAAATGLRGNETATAVLIMGGALVGVAVAGFGIILSMEERCRRLLDCGLPAEATILRVRRTGAALHAPGHAARPFVSVDLEAHVPAYDPIRTHATMALHESEADRLVPGARIPIRYDPAHPARVALDLAR